MVIENITRYLEMGMTPFDAAMRGSKEIGFTVLSMSTSLIAVFIPILLMGGIVGMLFREFAVTLSVAIAVSLLVSLTTTPMLCAKFLKARDESRHGPIYRASERAFQWLHHEYDAGLRWVLRHQWLILGVAVGTAFLNIYLFIIVPKGFFPQQDTGRLSGQTMAAQDISFPAMRDKQRTLAQMTLDDPAVRSVTAFAGGGRSSNNTGFMFIALKDPSQRKGVTADMVVNRLRAKLSSVPGARLFLQANQDIQIGGRGSAAQYQYTLSDENLEELNTWAPRLQARAAKMPELRDVSTDQQDQGLAANLVIDRDTASRLGISASTIDQMLYDAFGQREVSTMYTGLNQYFVVMEVDPQYQLSPDSLERDLCEGEQCDWSRGHGADAGLGWGNFDDGSDDERRSAGFVLHSIDGRHAIGVSNIGRESCDEHVEHDLVQLAIVRYVNGELTRRWGLLHRVVRCRARLPLQRRRRALPQLLPTPSRAEPMVPLSVIANLNSNGRR